MAMFQTLKMLPSHILGIEGELLGVLAFGLVGIVLIIIPFLDRGVHVGKKTRFSASFRDHAHCVYDFAHLHRLHGEPDKVILRLSRGQRNWSPVRIDLKDFLNCAKICFTDYPYAAWFCSSDRSKKGLIKQKDTQISQSRFSPVMWSKGGTSIAA